MRKSAVALVLVGVNLLSPLNLSQAATKTITVKAMSLITTLPGEEIVAGVLAKGATVFVFGNVKTPTGTDGFISSIDLTGTTLWSLPLHAGEANVVTSAAIDTAGNVIVFGASSNPDIVLSSPSTIPYQNPDSVTVDAVAPQRNDVTEALIWKVSATGQLISSNAHDLKSPVLVTAGVLTSTGFALVGNISTSTGMAGFFLTMTSAGAYSKPVYIGKVDTELNALVKKSNGFLVVGASSETISSKPPKGKRDGLVISLSVSGKTSAVVRSTNANAMRNWQSATSSNFLGGISRLGNKTEAVVTQFNAALIPTWTTRFLAGGGAFAADISATSRAAFFASTSTITGVTGWKASKGAGLTLIFGANGALAGAYSALMITAPIGLAYSADLGLVAVGSGPKGVSVFHALPR